MRKSLLLASFFFSCLTPIAAQDVAAQDARAPGGRFCHDYKVLMAHLGARFEEAPVSLGIQENGNLLQVFASERNGTWTIVSVTPLGLSCVLATGNHWESMPPVSTDPGA